MAVCVHHTFQDHIYYEALKQQLDEVAATVDLLRETGVRDVNVLALGVVDAAECCDRVEIIRHTQDEDKYDVALLSKGERKVLAEKIDLFLAVLEAHKNAGITLVKPQG